jgi:hypothetical protein
MKELVQFAAECGVRGVGQGDRSTVEASRGFFMRL